MLYRAALQEKNGHYGKACYTYAIAALHGVKPDECRSKIRELWHRYGPFDFTDQLKQIKEECTSCDSDSTDGHHDNTIEIIKEAVEDE